MPGENPVPGQEAAARPPPRAGPLRIAMRVLLAFGILALLFFLDQLRRDVEAADFTRVETGLSRLDGAGWVDPRWGGEVAQRLAQVPSFSSSDRAAIDRVANELSGLSFVAEVFEPEVLWPDGLRVPMRFRVPVACVRVGRQFLPVAEDGTVLSGAWPTPPSRASGYLPVIAMDPQEQRLSRPGSVLWNAPAQDGLSVAISMWQHLGASSVQRLGRIVIDARAARRASVEEPGTVLLLEQGRRILFGRAANTAEPGELPAQLKWEQIARALELLPGAGPTTGGDRAQASGGARELVDWELFDARWDCGEVLPRGGLPDALAGERRDGR